MSVTLGRFLEDIRSQAGGPGSTMLLSTLGQQLLLQGINLKLDAGLRLSDALQRYPAFCTVDGHHLRFLDGPAESAEGPLNLPRHPPRHPPSASATARGLRPDLWKARVFTREGSSFWMDLDDLCVQEVEGDEPPDPATPWRYLRVPAISAEEQTDFVGAWLAENTDMQHIEQITSAGYRWPREAERLLDPPTWRALRDARREWVVDQTLPWLDEHEIDHRRVVLVRSVAPRSTFPPQRPALGDVGTEALRARLIACIQRMTLDELAALRIPARFLVD